MRPLTNLQEKLQVIVAEIESNTTKVNELFKARGITEGDHPLALLLKATVVLVGWSQLSELSDWSECKKVYFFILFLFYFLFSGLLYIDCMI